MSTRGQRVAQELRETIERRIAARVAAADVAGVRAIRDVAEYGVEIASGSLDRMASSEASEAGVDSSQPETGWNAPSAVAQELLAERDAALANAKRERDLHVREENDYEAALKLVSLERDALRENSRIQGEKIEALIESRNQAVRSADSLSQELSATIKGRAQLLAERNELLAQKHALPANIAGIVQVHSGDDIPEPTPPPRSAPAKIDRRGTKQAAADKKAAKEAAKEGAWGKAQYKKLQSNEHEHGSNGSLSMGAGCAVHPSKKKLYKIQGEKDPDTKNVRAMVAAVRPSVASPVFPSIPAELDKVSQIITPVSCPEPAGLEKVPTWTPNPADPEAAKKFGAERERINKHNATAREEAEKAWEAMREQRDKDRARRLSQGNLAAYKALKFWVHHKIKETRGLTACDRGEMYKEHGNAIREIADKVAQEHNTTRQTLATWVWENIDHDTGNAIMGATTTIKRAA
jgi:hypothetical protein